MDFPSDEEEEDLGYEDSDGSPDENSDERDNPENFYCGKCGRYSISGGKECFSSCSGSDSDIVYELSLRNLTKRQSNQDSTGEEEEEEEENLKGGKEEDLEPSIVHLKGINPSNTSYLTSQRDEFDDFLRYKEDHDDPEDYDEAEERKIRVNDYKHRKALSVGDIRRRKTKASKTFTLSTFNLWRFGKKNDGEYQRDIDTIVSTFRTMSFSKCENEETSIIIIQEALSNNLNNQEILAFKTLLGEGWECHISDLSTRKDNLSRQVDYFAFFNKTSRFAFQSGEFIEKNLVGNSNFSYVPYCVHWKFLDAHIVSTISVHLTPSKNDSSKRQEECQKIMEWIESRTDWRNQVWIVAGDFNFEVEEGQTISAIFADWTHLNELGESTNTASVGKPYDDCFVFLPDEPTDQSLEELGVPVIDDIGNEDKYEFLCEPSNFTPKTIKPEIHAKLENHQYRSMYSDHKPCFFSVRAMVVTYSVNNETI